MGRELQNLSLTIGSFERILFAFIKDEMLEQEDSLRDNAALKEAIPLLNKDKKYATLSGGIGSLLRHAMGAMADTCALLQTLENEHDPDKNAKWTVGTGCSMLLMYAIGKRYYHAKTTWSFFKTTFLNRSTMKYYAWLYVVYDVWHRIAYRVSNVRKLKMCHCRISLTLRLFLLCQKIIQRSRASRTNSQRLLIDAPSAEDYDDNMKNATFLLVERVPVPADYYLRSSNTIGLRIFNFLCNVSCASTGTAYSLLGHNEVLWTRFGKALTIILFPYFGVLNNKAARYATRLLIDQPNIEVIRNAWGLAGDSKLSIMYHTLMAPKLPLRQKVFVDARGKRGGSYRRCKDDLEMHLFSVRPLQSIIDGTWDNASIPLKSDQQALGLPNTRPVLFYIHGGGWFARFFAQDILNLSRWAEKIGALIVYPGIAISVFPYSCMLLDYGLSPETQYPHTVEQCLAIYKFVTKGGLGFTPSRIVLFGESAGGNLAAALMIRLIQEKYNVRPGGVLLNYPALNLHLSPSPSRFLHQNDPVLPRGILELALNSYYPGHAKKRFDQKREFVASPGIAPDAILKQFPTTTITVGDLDPLLDDSVDFDTRLRRLGVAGELHVLPGALHGFLISNAYDRDAQAAVDKSGATIRKFLIDNSDVQ